MIDSVTNKKYLPYLASIFVTAIFALKWIHCLPFSGYMPIVDFEGTIRIGSYMIYAKEPFCFPLGLIKGLTFPFYDMDILRTGAIPMFAIPFKLFSKIYMPLSECYYFVLIELLSVFFTAFFAYILLERFKVRYFILKLLGTVLCALSFPLLARSNIAPLLVMHFPIYLIFAYCYMQLMAKISFKWSMALLGSIIIASLADPYVLYGVLLMTGICFSLNLMDFIISPSHIKYKRLVVILIIFLSGALFSSGIIFLVAVKVSGFREHFDWVSSLNFGFGGGYHVADIFSLIIPPGNMSPGASYLAKLGCPVTTDSLQSGQYEGFAYIGTVTISVLCILAMFGIFFVLRNFRVFFVKLKLRLASRLYTNVLLSPVITIGIAVFIVYILSWGYVFHVFGRKIGGISFTPSGIMAEMWHKLFFIRSLGRLSMPAVLYVTIAAVVGLDRYFYRPFSTNNVKRVFFAIFVTFLIVIHVYEVKSYIAPIKSTKNIISSVFNAEESGIIKKSLKNKIGLFLIPEIGLTMSDDYLKSIGWDRTCYALAFYSGIHTTIERDARIDPRHNESVKSDINKILNGSVKEIAVKYGDIAIAAPYKVAYKILKNSNTALDAYRIKDTIILTLHNR